MRVLYDRARLYVYFLVGLDPTMKILEFLENEGKIYSTIDAYTYFPMQVHVDSEVYERVRRFILDNQTEIGITFSEIRNFLGGKFTKRTSFKLN